VATLALFDGTRYFDTLIAHVRTYNAETIKHVEVCVYVHVYMYVKFFHKCMCQFVVANSYYDEFLISVIHFHSLVE